MAFDDIWRLVACFSWTQNIFIEYFAERYKSHPNAIVSGIIREFAIKDKGFNVETFRETALGADELRIDGRRTVQLIKDIAWLEARRKGLRPETPPTPPAAKRKRKYRLYETSQVTLTLFDYAILYYYGRISGHLPNYALRHIMRVYMVADKRLKIDDFRWYFHEVRKEIHKKHHDEIDASWENFESQWYALHRPGKRRPALKAS